MNERAAEPFTSDQSAVLKAFARALGRESHVLTQHPDLLWQQLYNRLQWEENEMGQILAPELARRSAGSARPWLRLSTPYRESRSALRTFEGHTDRIEACVFSPDGQHIVSTSYDKTVRVWDVQTGRPANTFKGQYGRLNGCSFSPAGLGVLLAGAFGEFKIWDVFSGQVIRNFSGRGDVEACIFSPDGRTILSGGSDKSLCLWDASTGELQQTIPGHSESVIALAFSPDGKFFASSAYDKTVKLWNAPDGKLLQTLYSGNEAVHACEFSPDGSLLALASWDKTLRLLSVPTGGLLRIFEGHTRGVTACSFSPEGKCIVSSSDDNTLRLWDVQCGDLLGVLEGHTDGVTACSYSRDGKYIISASHDKTLRLWDATGIQTQQFQEGHSQAVNASAFAPDGRSFVTTGWDKALRHWSTSTGELIHSVEAVNDARDGKFTPDGRYILAASDLILFWDSVSCQPVKLGSNTTTHSALDVLRGGNSFAISPDGGLIAIAWRHSISFHDTISGTWLFSFHADADEDDYDSVRSSAFSPDGRLIITSSDKDTLRVWDVATRKVRYILDGHSIQGVNTCAFSPNGCSILSGGDDHTLRLWDTGTGQMSRVLAGHSGRVTGCGFSPDGRFIFSTGSDKTLRVWDPENGRLLACLFLPGDLQSLGVHPSKNTLICGDLGGAVYRLEIIGLNYGPIVCSAIERMEGLSLLCPVCQKPFLIEEESLGEEMTCPQAGCQTPMKINPFVIRHLFRTE
jgi:WD40 repeat protein